ncbi:hypothetical protein ACFVUP_38545 [Streptomyces bacillaris]|uniref:hypothetical protein n=1 Tax=Streptomyces bacillaris TaxID=68179 RepID=UPI0036DDFDC6
MTTRRSRPSTSAEPARRPVYLKPAEVAERFHTTVGNLSQLRFQDRGPAYSKFGRSILYAEDDVYAWVERSRYVPAHD